MDGLITEVLPCGPLIRPYRATFSPLGRRERTAMPLFPSPLGESDCLWRQAFCHGFASRMIALRMVRSFRMVATRATIFGLPASSTSQT